MKQWNNETMKQWINLPMKKSEKVLV
jgi:hypothetical protein